jgi:hypothetical protein
MKRTLAFLAVLTCTLGAAQFIPTYPCETIDSFGYNDEENDPLDWVFVSYYENVCNCPGGGSMLTAWVPWWSGILEFTSTCSFGYCDKVLHIGDEPGVDWTCNLIQTTIPSGYCLTRMDVTPTWIPRDVTCDQQNPCIQANYPPYSGTIEYKEYASCP